MEFSLLFCATVFIKISFVFSEDPIFISTVLDDVDLNSNQDLLLEPEEWEFVWLTGAFISYLKFTPGEVILNSDSEKQFINEKLQPALFHGGIDSSSDMANLFHSELNSLMMVQENIIDFKGVCMVRMLHLSVGNNIFHQSLINYLKSSGYPSMNLDSLWFSFQYQMEKFNTKYSLNIKQVMNSWIKQDGFPVVYVDIKNNIAKLGQKVYLIGNSTDDNINGTWWIPLTWTSASEANFQSTAPKYWFYKNEDEVILQMKEDDWVIFNIQNAGFYRVNYDEASWHRIIYALHLHPLDRISAINRASIISDAFNLAKAGIISFEVAFNSVSYITRETDWLPIQTALTELKFLSKYFSGSNSTKLFNNFWLTMIKPSYDRLNQHKGANDDIDHQLQQTITHWACILGLENCVENVLQNFELWKTNPKLFVRNHENKLMFCIAVKHNPSLDENDAIRTILKYYSSTFNITDRAIAISSLKCIEKLEVLRKILNEFLSNCNENVLQKQEFIYLLKMIATNSYRHAEFISNFIIDNQSQMLKYYGNINIFNEILESLFEILDVSMNPNEYYLYETTNGNELIETVDTTFKKNLFHYDFFTRHYPNIIQWIKNNQYFMPLEIEDETIANNPILELIDRSFQLFQLFYQENSYSTNLLSSLDASYYFWKRTFNDWAYLLTKINQQDQQKILELHMFKIISPLFEKLGFHNKPDDSYEKKALRTEVIDWACRLNHPDCILNARKLFKAWRFVPHPPIPKPIQRAVFCTAIRYEFDDMWFFLKTYLTTRNHHTKLAIEYGFGCINDVDDIQEIFAIIFNLKRFQSEEQLRIFASINFYRGYGLQEILRYLCTINLNMFISEDDIIELNMILKKILFHISTSEQIKLFKICLNEFSDKIPSLRMHAKSSLENVAYEIDQFNQFSVNFLSWLKTTYTSFDNSLPKNMYPLKYEVSISPEKTYFYGAVKIILEVIQDTDRIVLHAANLIIDEIDVRYLNTNESIDVLFFLEHLDSRCEIYLDTIITSGTRLVVTITYGGSINNESYGIFRNPLRKSNGNWFITTQFQMTHARRAFPCFDEPSFKAKFVIRILRPNSYISISNTQIVYSVPSLKKLDWTWDIYEESELISTYLVAFIICKHRNFYGYNLLKYWSGHKRAPYAKFIIEIAQQAIEVLSSYTDISLPMKKIDLVEISGFNELGMENWGIIIIDDLLVSISSAAFNTDVLRTITFKEFVVVHEIVHTWFGNLVTCETWEYFWLNEGFTGYFEWQVMNTAYPQLKWMDKFIVHIQQTAFALDSLISGLPLTNSKLNLFTRINANRYDNSALIHIKAPCIVRMMHSVFGDEVFNTAVRYYLKENQWHTGTPLKLWNAIEIALLGTKQESYLKKTNQSVATIMESWTSQPGYPVVHVNKTNDKLIFKQERFLSKREQEPTELYWVPITITMKFKSTVENTSFFFWMGLQTISTSLPNINHSEWIIVNFQQEGFYRVNYDVNTWMVIFEALNQNDFGGIPEITRAQILDDLFNLAYADYISYQLVFDGARYLKQERGYLPWKVFFNAMENLYEKFDDPGVCLGLKNYIKELITPYYYEIQAMANIDVEHRNDFVIAPIMLWARYVDFEDLVIKSLKNFKEWTEHPERPLNQSISSLCIALQHSSYSDWQFMSNQYFKSKSKSERSTILNILGCSRNITILTDYMKLVIFSDNWITKHSIKAALVSIFYVERLSIDAILNFLIKYHTELTTGDIWDKAHILLLAISRNIYTSHQITQLKKLITNIGDTNEKIRDQLLDYLPEIITRKEWYDNHVTDILQSLNKKYLIDKYP